MNYQNNVVEGQTYRIFFYRLDGDTCDEMLFGIRNGEILNDEEVISKAFYELFKDNHTPDQLNDENLERFFGMYQGATIVNRSYLTKTERRKPKISEVIKLEKCIIAIKDNDFAEVGHCFRCEIKSDKVTIYNDLSRFNESYVITIDQLHAEFLEISKDDYDTYFEACSEGEDTVFEAVIKKYLN